MTLASARQLALLIAAVLVVGALAARRPDAITVQLDAMARAAGLMRATYDTHRDWLYEDARAPIDFHAEAGARYTMIAACDIDCLQLDLSVRVDDGSVVGAHDDANRPILSFEPKQTGRYELEAVMARCRIQPCQFGIRIYRR